MRFGQEHIGALVQGRYSLVTQQRGRVLGPGYHAHDHEDSSEVFLKLFVRWPAPTVLQDSLQKWLTWGGFDAAPPDLPWGPTPSIVGDDPRGTFLVSPWLVGSSLADGWPAADDLTLVDVVGTLTKALEAMRALHATGLIHGALRPSQVLLTEHGAVNILRPGLDLFVAPTLRSDPDRWALIQAARGSTWAPEVRAYFDESAPFPTAAADLYGFGRVIEAVIDLLPETLGPPRERLRATADVCSARRPEDRPTIDAVLQQLDLTLQRHRRPRAHGPHATGSTLPKRSGGEGTPASRRRRRVPVQSERPDTAEPLEPPIPPQKPEAAATDAAESPPVVQPGPADATIPMPAIELGDGRSSDPSGQQERAPTPIVPGAPDAADPFDAPIGPGDAGPEDPTWFEPDDEAPAPEPKAQPPANGATGPSARPSPAPDDDGLAADLAPPPKIASPRVLREWAEADSFARFGLNGQAIEKAEAVLRLDPTFEPAKALLARLGASPPVSKSPAPAEDQGFISEPVGDADRTVLAPVDSDEMETQALKREDRPVEPRPLDENVQFTVYRPPQLIADQWADLLFFTHLSERRPDASENSPDPVAEVQRLASNILQDSVESYDTRTADARAAIPKDGTLTIVPMVDGVTFNPPQASFVWSEDVHLTRFRARSAAAGTTVRGVISVFFGPVLVGDVPLALRVDPQGVLIASLAPEVPTTGRRYRKIFASYSRRDLEVVRSFESFARGLGDRYLIDLLDLRAGEVWSDRLEEMIQSADVFQLFWSQNAMASTHVLDEVRCALANAQDIRPIFWERPLPQDPTRDLPPPELSKLHFQFLAAMPPSDPATGQLHAEHLQSPSPPPDAPSSGPPDVGVRLDLPDLAASEHDDDEFDASKTRAVEIPVVTPRPPLSAPSPESGWPQVDRSGASRFPATPSTHTQTNGGVHRTPGVGMVDPLPERRSDNPSALMLVVVAFGLALLIVSVLMLIWFNS